MVNKLILLFAVFLFSMSFVYAGTCPNGIGVCDKTIPFQSAVTSITQSVNYSLHTVNNSQFLQSLTPQQVADLFSETDPIWTANSSAVLGCINNASYLSTYNSSYVPYTGATGDVDLRPHNLYVSNTYTYYSGTDMGGVGFIYSDLDARIYPQSTLNFGNVFSITNVSQLKVINNITTTGNFLGSGQYLTNVSTFNSTYNSKADYQFLNNNFNGSGNFTTTGPGTLGNVLINSVSDYPLDVYTHYGTGSQDHAFAFDPMGYFMISPDLVYSVDFAIADTTRSMMGANSIFSAGHVFADEGVIANSVTDMMPPLYIQTYKYLTSTPATNFPYAIYINDGSFTVDENYNLVTTGKGTFGTLIIPTKATTGDPASPVEGQIYTNTFDNKLRIYTDGAWRNIITW